MHAQRLFVAFERRLQPCRDVVTLGVKPNFFDYSDEERQLIHRTPKIYYPSLFYADLFDSLGMKTFPGGHTYRCAADKIKQTTLLQMAGLPHPRTRLFFGRRQKRRIEALFSYPFIAKIPRGSARGRGVFLIKDRQELAAYCEKSHVAYIQDYFPAKKDIRVVVIGHKPVLAYWRVAGAGEFRTNIACGGRIDLDHIPEAAVTLALSAARRCGWDDVGMDIMVYKNRYYVLEANMKYGRQGFDAAGLNYYRLMEEMMAGGEI